MKTNKAYAMFIKKEDGFHSLFVENDSPVREGVWCIANDSAEKILGSNGRWYVKSAIGLLAYRPGKHLAKLPIFDHIGTKDKDGNLVRKSDSVICEVEYIADIDYTNDAINRSKEMHNGKAIKYDCCLDFVPRHGFYNFTTNSKAKTDWLIVGEYKITRVLSEDEVVAICDANGIKAQRLA